MNTKYQAVLCSCALTLLLQACGGQSNPAATTGTATAEAVTPAPASTTETTADLSGAPSFQTLDGKSVKLSDYAGKKVFVNLWATWCAPCIREIPSIQRAAEALKSENFEFLLASDEELDKIKDFLLDRGFMGNFVKLNGYVGSYGADVMPTSLLFDEQGKQIAIWKGPAEWDSAEMLAELRNTKAVAQ